MYRILAFQGLVIHLVVLTSVSPVGSGSFLSSRNDLTWRGSPISPPAPKPTATPSMNTTQNPLKKESYVERIIRIRAQKAKKAALDYKLGNHIEDLYWLTRLKRGSRVVYRRGTLFRKDTRRTTPPPERRVNSAVYKPSTAAPFIYGNSLPESGFKKPTNLISSDHNRIQLNFISNHLEDEISSAQASKKIYSFVTSTGSPLVRPTTTTMTSVIATSTTPYPSTTPPTTDRALSRVIPPTPAPGKAVVASTPTYREVPGFPVYYKPSYYSDPQWYKPRRIEDDFYFLLQPKAHK